VVGEGGENFAPKEMLEGDYLDNLTRDGFNQAHDISSSSLAAIAKAGRHMMQNRKDASILTLSYLGAVRAFPGYNVMGLAKASLEANVRYLAHSLGPEGIRVNAISAGDWGSIMAAINGAAALEVTATADPGDATQVLLENDVGGAHGNVAMTETSPALTKSWTTTSMLL